MAWVREDEPAGFIWADHERELRVRLNPFHLSVVNKVSGQALHTTGAATPADGGNDLTGEAQGGRPGDAGSAPVAYRVATEILGSYAGRGPSPRWFGFSVAREWEVADDLLRLELSGSTDPLARRCWVSIRCLEDVPISLQVRVDPAIALAETALNLVLEDDDQFFGLGERFAYWDHRGHTVEGWTEDSPFCEDERHEWTYWPLPYVLTGRGLGLVVDSSLRTRFRFGSERANIWTASVDSSVLDLLLFACRSPRHVVENFTALKGRPPIPPVWGLGVWKTMLGGQKRVEAEVNRMQQEDLPLSAVWIYDQLEPETNSGWGSAMGYPEGSYDDLPGLVGRMHERGYKVLGYVNPQFLAGRKAFEEGDKSGYFLQHPKGGTYLLPCPDPGRTGQARTGTGALLDPTNPYAVTWWSEMLKRLLTETGYDGWMHDFGELTPSDAVAFDRRTGAELRNDYPVEYQRPCYEAVRRYKPDAVFFVRSGSLGSTSVCPAVWPGDQHTDWSSGRGIRSALRAGLSLALAGVNTFGPDIGGFFGTVDPAKNEQSKELWIRWCQLGALSPVMRDHLGHKRREGVEAVDLWHDEETVGIWRRYGELHLALMPYLYSLAHEAHRTGVATMRPLLLEFPDDPVARSVDDQYLLGPALLVAPVLSPGTTRRVYFPAGSWRSFWDDHLVDGPGWQDVSAAHIHAPLFMRSNTILPLSLRQWRHGESLLAEPLLEEVELRVNPSSGPHLTSETSLYDGSVLRLTSSESTFELEMQFAGGPARRHWHVRLPEAAGFRRAVMRGESGEESDLPLAGPEARRRWWDHPGIRAEVETSAPSKIKVVLSP